MKLRKFAGIMSAAIMMVAAAGLNSCNSDSPDNPLQGTVPEIVTIESIADNGMTFTLRQSGDSPLVTYTTSLVFPKDEEFKVGERVLIYFKTSRENIYTSGPIELVGYIKCYNGELRKATDSETGSTPENIPYVTQISRSGNYLNVYAYVFAMYKPEKMEVVYKPAMNEHGEISAFIATSKITAPTSSVLPIYGSYDLRGFWAANPGCNKLKISYETPNGPKEYSIIRYLPLD